MLENDVLQVVLATLLTLTHEDCLLEKFDGPKVATGRVSPCSFLHMAMYLKVLLVSHFPYAIEHLTHPL